MNTHQTDLLDPFAALERAGTLDSPEDRPDEAVLAARAAVRRAATTSTLHQKVTTVRRRRVRAAIAVAGLAAAAVVGFVTVGGAGDTPLGTPAAAAVLEGAAEAALAEPSREVGPGEFLQITLIEEFETSVERRTIWVPQDVDAAWTFREGSEVWQQPSWADDDGGQHIVTYDPDWYASLSGDPDAMLEQIRAAIGGEGGGVGYDFWEIQSEVLRSPFAPAEVRAALFRALADTDGMTVATGVELPGGGTGTALGVAGSPDDKQMLFDESGAHIGEQATDYRARVESSVVDELPQRVRTELAGSGSE